MRLYWPFFFAFSLQWQVPGWQGDYALFANSPQCRAAAFDRQSKSLRGNQHAENQGIPAGNHVEQTLMDTIFTAELVQICEGETASIFGVPTSVPGDYSQAFVAANGGDSIHTISLLVNDTFWIEQMIAICPGDSALIFGEWQSQPGNYSQTLASLAGCDSTTVVVLALHQPPVLAFETQLACPFESDGVVTAIASGGMPPYQYAWETGNDSSAQLSGLDVGVYTLTVTDAVGCTTVDSIELKAAARPTVSSMVTDLTCFNAGDGVLTILADDPNLQFSFNGSPIGPQTVFDSVFAGGHEFFVIDTFGCIWDQFFNVDSPDPIDLSLPGDRQLEQGDSFRISSLTTAAPLSFDWSPPDGLSCADCPDPVATPDTTTRYFLTVTDADGCTATEDILLTVDIVPAVKVPNAFSPNGDGVNDRFYVFGDGLAEVRFLRIFDRWGELVFEKANFPANDPSNGWDGQHRGKPAAADVFVFYLSVGLLDGSVRFVKGDLTLLR